MGKGRRGFDEEFKREAVRLAESEAEVGGQSCGASPTLLSIDPSPATLDRFDGLFGERFLGATARDKSSIASPLCRGFSARTRSPIESINSASSVVIWIFGFIEKLEC